MIIPLEKQLALDPKGIPQNQRFLRVLWNRRLSHSRRWFNLKGGDIARDLHPEMTLDRFLDEMERAKHLHIRLQINSPTPGEIMYVAMQYSGEPSQTARVTCPYTPTNYASIAQAYKRAFHQRLEDAEGL